QSRDLHHVLPDVLRQNLGEASEELFFLVALFLKGDAVAVQKDGAAVGELGRQLRFEGVFSVGGDGQTKLIRHRLQQHAIAGRATIGQLEVGDIAVLHEQDFDILTADVADHIDVSKAVHGAHHVSDGLDDIDVGQNRFFQDVSGVTRGPKAQTFQGGTLTLNAFFEFSKKLFGVLDRVTLRKLVGL